MILAERVYTGTGGGWVSVRCPDCGRLVGDVLWARPGAEGRLQLAMNLHMREECRVRWCR